MAKKTNNAKGLGQRLLRRATCPANISPVLLYHGASKSSNKKGRVWYLALQPCSRVLWSFSCPWIFCWYLQKISFRSVSPAQQVSNFPFSQGRCLCPAHRNSEALIFVRSGRKKLQKCSWRSDDKWSAVVRKSAKSFSTIIVPTVSSQDIAIQHAIFFNLKNLRESVHPSVWRSLPELFFVFTVDLDVA